MEELVDRQIRRWEQTERQLEVKPSADVQQPMVCISREFGSQGLEIARFVAGRLGYDLYDRDLVERLAEDARLRDRILETLSPSARASITRRLEEEFDELGLAPSEYLTWMTTTLYAVGRHGHGVVLGRGAQFVLEPEATLRVRVFSPFEKRVARVAERYGLSSAEARSRVLHEDAERAAFCWRHFHRDVSDPTAYDMLLNSEALSVAACSALVIDAFHAKLGG
jgi:cytidylate kinase